MSKPLPGSFAYFCDHCPITTRNEIRTAGEHGDLLTFDLYPRDMALVRYLASCADRPRATKRPAATPRRGDLRSYATDVGYLYPAEQRPAVIARLARHQEENPLSYNEVMELKEEFRERYGNDSYKLARMILNDKTWLEMRHETRHANMSADRWSKTRDQIIRLACDGSDSTLV
jgi:hypothetical protein